MTQFLKNSTGLLRDSFILLRKSKPLILSSSTAFFATFSLPPIIVILVTVTSVYFKTESINQEVFIKIESYFGNETAGQIEIIVENFRSMGSNWWFATLGFLFLVFVSTTLLHVIKLAINQIWGIKKKPANKLKYNLIQRGVAFGMIIFVGLLLGLSLLLDTTILVLGDLLEAIIPGIDRLIIKFINELATILVASLWFGMLFKLIPDARIRWRVAGAGGLVTGVLFNSGQFILERALINSNIGNIYGASASIALLLLFIFYSSMIMYFGAACTYNFAKMIDRPIKPGKYAEKFELNILATEALK